MAVRNCEKLLRVGAVTVGLGAALAIGPGLAVASPDESPTVSSASSADTSAPADTRPDPASDTKTGDASESQQTSPDPADPTTTTPADVEVSTFAAAEAAEDADDAADARDDGGVTEGTEVTEAAPAADAQDVAATLTEPAADIAAVAQPTVAPRDDSPAAADPAATQRATAAVAEDIEPAPAETEPPADVASANVAAASPVVSAAASDVQPNLVVIDTTTVTEVVPNPVRSVMLGFLGLFGFDPNVSNYPNNPIYPTLELIWGMYRRIEAELAGLLTYIGIPATITTTTYVTTVIDPQTTSAVDLLGAVRTIGIGYSAELGKYYLKDAVRDITTYEATTYLGSDGLAYPVNPPGSTVFQVGAWDVSAVSAHANLTATYDYYLDVLNYRSYDGTGAAIGVTVVSNVMNNAYWYRAQHIFVFGHDFEAALDIVAHEFTHAVVDSVVGSHSAGQILGRNAESRALEEAYADILGALIEGKSGAGRWLIGEDYGCSAPSGATGCAIRNLADPSQLGGAEHYSQFSASADEHRNSTIFSFAAYTMMTDARTVAVTSQTWADVFYESLYQLPSGASFVQARTAVLGAATTAGLNAVERQAISDAFAGVGIGSAARAGILV